MRQCFLALAVALLSITALCAATLDFSGLPLGVNASPIVLSNATLTSATGTFYVGAAGIDHEICALSGGNCQADIDILFNYDITGLTLVTSGYNPGDAVDFRAYDASDNLIFSVLGQAANGSVLGLAGVSGVRRLYIDDNSTGGGFGYDHFEFTAEGVPEPATISLLALGLIGFGILRRRS